MVQIKKINSNEVTQDHLLDADYFIKKKRILENYNSFFGWRTRKKFLNIIKISFPRTIKHGDIVFYNKGVNFKLEVANTEKENTSRFFIFEIIDGNYTSDFILWFFSQKEVQDYLSLFVKGNIIAFLPKSAFNDLDIILPTKIGQNLDAVNITANSEFKEIIKKYLEEYRKNLQQSNFLSASFLVWSICEAILYQFLLDKGVKKQYLENKMLGQLLEIVGITNLDIMNLEDFKTIKDFRNLIHPKNSLKNINKFYSLEREIEPTFNRIIKNFDREVKKSKAHLNIVKSKFINVQFFMNSANYTYLNVDLIR